MISLMMTCGFMVAVIDFGHVSSPSEGLTGSIAATTIGSFTATPSTVYVGDPVTFTATASSTTGSQLTFTFFYDAVDIPYPTNNTESPYSTHTTGNPGTVTTSFTYTRLGNLTTPGLTSYYIVRLLVGDGSNTVSSLKQINVIENTAPTFVDSLPTSLTLDPDEVADFDINVSDPDDDPVTVTWDFGDGVVAVDETGNALLGIAVSQSHAWSPDIGPGMGPVFYYSMVVTLEDPHSNTVSATVVIGIRLPYNGLPVIYFDASSNNVDPDVEDEVTFYASAKDPEGEALTWTFVVNNSVEDVDVIVSHTDVTPVNTTVWNNLTYAFGNNPGTYNVRLYVSDALIPYQIAPHNVTKPETVTVIGNAVPSVVDQIAMSDESPTIDTAVTFVIVTFTIQAYDGDGDVLTVAWDMDDGVPRTNSSDGGWTTYEFNQDRLFNTTGSFNISATVTDGLEGHDVTKYRLVNVTSNNLPPVVIELNFTYETGDFALVGESVEFTLTLSDPEMDVLEIVWDFGDNTSQVYFNLTEYVDDVVMCRVNHTFNEVGVHNLTITYTDNQIGLLTHQKVKYAQVTVDELYIEVVDVWSWWDYTSLALLLIIPIVFILNLLRIRVNRRRFEEKGGQSWQEMKLRESEMSVEEESDFYTEVD
ncbi:MAG: hypothetical protein IH630_04145 [Thermoplasmata archaeon]|nr:hypothetical protein [Thermoplasmata archaeon]TFG70855.1 MAG: hypothetical protein E4H25_00850 [Methanomassiliicoccus sp.]